MATYGMKRMSAQVLAARDMGMTLPYPQFELLDNFGEREVIDLSPPLSPVWSLVRGRW